MQHIYIFNASDRDYLIANVTWSFSCLLTLSVLNFWVGLFHLWILESPLLKIGMSAQNRKQNIKPCRSGWNGSLRAVSSGSTLFAKLSVLVCRDERINCYFFKTAEPIRTKLGRQILFLLLLVAAERVYGSRPKWSLPKRPHRNSARSKRPWIALFHQYDCILWFSILKGSIFLKNRHFNILERFNVDTWY